MRGIDKNAIDFGWNNRDIASLWEQHTIITMVAEMLFHTFYRENCDFIYFKNALKSRHVGEFQKSPRNPQMQIIEIYQPPTLHISLHTTQILSQSYGLNRHSHRVFYGMVVDGKLNATNAVKCVFYIIQLPPNYRIQQQCIQHAYYGPIGIFPV